MATAEWMCPICEKRFMLDADIIAPTCKPCYEAGREVELVAFFDSEERQEMLKKYLYCRNCEHIDLVEDFSFNGSSEDPDSERCCPNCHSDDVVNMGAVPMCESCDEVPAAKDEYWCQYCIDQHDQACELYDPYEAFGEW